MARLTRAETQERNRAKVLDAAKAEFSERGFRDAKIDAIAERAELTRGAVYSNFPGKRALYFGVLAANLPESEPQPGHTAREALGAFARAWVTRLPLSSELRWLGMDLMPEILADERTRKAFAQLQRLNAVLLGRALERLSPNSKRLVRVAEAALTTLHGASQLAAAAPGFGEPFNVVKACEQVLDLDLTDGWTGPPIVPQAEAVDEPSTEPDGVITTLGLHRLSAAEDAIRAADDVALRVVTGDPAELLPLARLVIAEFDGLLRQAFPAKALPQLRIGYVDEPHDDMTETAVRIENGRVVARAQGFGAGHASATFARPRP